MAELKVSKVVSSLPGTLVADTIYFVRVGAGFDLYVTNSSGTIVAYALNTTAGGGGRSVYVTTADLTESAGVATNTALTFTGVASAKYRIECTLRLKTASAGGGIFAITVPAGASVEFLYMGPTGFNSTAQDVGFGYGSGVFSTSTQTLRNSTEVFCYKLFANVIIGATGGAVTLQIKRNSGSITLAAGSSMQVD